MDASFDQFGGGGWGEHGGQQDSGFNQFQKNNFTDKIPIPAAVEDLLAMSNDEEKYVIGNFSFNTVRIMGKVVSVFTDSNQCTTYEICDSMALDARVAKRFTVIRYGGSDLQPNAEQLFSEGQTIQAVGKLRLFNNRLSLVSFHIRAVIMNEVELYKMECKLAKYYFEKNLPEKTHGLDNSLFRSALTLASGGATSKQPQQPQQTTPSRSNVSLSRQNPIQSPHQQQQQSQTGNTPKQKLTVQQNKIMDYIRSFGDANKDGSGVHLEQIRAAIKPNQYFTNDLQFLLDEGKIYTTLDDDHFSIIDEIFQ